MFQRGLRYGLPFFGILLLVVSIASATEDYLKLVPTSVWGVGVFNQLENVDAKIETIGRETRLPMQGLSSLVEMKLGPEQGVDPKGSFVWILLPPGTDRELKKPIAVVLVPITDYNKFLTSANAKETKEGITEIQFHGRAFARELGGYAAVTNSNSGRILSDLSVSKEIPKKWTKWQKWLVSCDVAMVFPQAGLQVASQSLDELIDMIFISMGKRMPTLMSKSSSFTKIMEDVDSLGVGMQFDQQSAFQLEARVALVSGSSSAQRLAQWPVSKEDLLKGLHDDPFVFAGGGRLSPDMSKNLMDFYLGMMKLSAEIYGVSDDQAEAMRKISEGIFSDLRSMSFVLAVSGERMHIYENSMGFMQVEDSQAFLVKYEKFMKEYNELVKGSKGLIQPMPYENCEVGGAKGIKLSMRISEEDLQHLTELHKNALRGILGPERKLDCWVLALDKQTILFAYFGGEKLVQQLEDLKQKKPDLSANPNIKKVSAFIPAGSVVVVYFSPAGMVEFQKKVMEQMLPSEMKRLKIPPFPETPPVAFAMNAEKDELQLKLVVPVEVFRGFGEFSQQRMKK